MQFASAIKQILMTQMITLATSSLAAAGGFRISGYMGVGPDANMIVIDGGRQDGVASGDVFRVFRSANSINPNDGISIETGEAKALMVYDHKTLAEITKQSTPVSRQFYPRFPEIMAGDIAVRQRLEIKKSVALTPELGLTYAEIFEDPKASPQSFELSKTGRENLAKEADRLGSVRASRLMVIAHTDAKGSSEANQVESYQRAVVIRQFLIDELGFDPSRVVAIGKGEDDLPETALTPGSSERARRVVLKIIPES